MDFKKVLLILFVLGCIPLFAQQVTTSAHGIVGFPMGDFGESLNQIGFGPEVGLRISLPETPLWFGLDFGVLTLHQKKRYVNTADAGIELEPLKGEILAHFVTRIQIERENMIPYIEGLIGIQHFYSESSDDTDPIYAPTNNSSGFSTSEVDRIWSAGFATGMLMHIWEYESESDNKIKNIYLDARLRTVFGGEVDIVRGQVGVNSDEFDSAPERVRSNMLTFQIGVMFEF